MAKIRIFFISIFVTLLLTVVLFLIVVNYCGRGVTDQPWVLDLYPLKKHMAANKQDPKIIIVGGSSSLFGINGKKLHEYTGLDNINFSMSIMVPMRFYLTDLERNVKKGDIVVLPLELTNHYYETKEKIFSNFGISLLFGCIPETQKNLTFPELCSLYFQYGFSWINTSLFHENGTLRRLFKNKRKQGLFDGVYSDKYAYTKWMEFHTKGKKEKAGIYSDLSVYGDWMVDKKWETTDILSFPLSTIVSEEFLFAYNRIRDLVKKRCATLMLVWPNIYFYPEQTGFSDFKRLLEHHGITIYGRPEAMAFPKELYHDPIAHMNVHGAELWTWELAKLISQTTGRPLKKRNRAWPYIVFADKPEYYFPGVKTLHTYDTGVRIGQKEFPVVLDIPENLRGKELELSLIANLEQKRKTVFSEVTVAGKNCKLTESLYQERMEAIICLPAQCTGKKQVMLNCSIRGNSIGMERIFIREAHKAGLVSFQSGFSVPEEWGRWTDGPRAEFSVLIPRVLKKKKLKLNMDIFTFVAPKRPVCRFKISFRGKYVQEFQSDKFENKLTVEIPEDAADTAELPLIIEVSDPVSPKELGLSDDARKLGIGIRNVTIEAVSKDGEEQMKQTR